MKFKGNFISLEHGTIEMYLDVGSHLCPPCVIWDCEFKQNDKESLWDDFLTLEEAMCWYKDMVETHITERG